MSLGSAIGVFIIGILLGSVFTFGVQFWNAGVERTDCILVETKFMSYDEMERVGCSTRVKEIAIDCSNGERYFIDGVSINNDLKEALHDLKAQENIVLLIHPNSDAILEFTAGDVTLMSFNETIKELEGEATGFLFLGIFMYLCALIGVYNIGLHIIKKGKLKSR